MPAQSNRTYGILGAKGGGLVFVLCYAMVERGEEKDG